MSEELIASASLSEQACFVGKGATFEIWQPEAFEIYATKAREIAKKDRQILQFSGKREDR